MSERRAATKRLDAAYVDLYQKVAAIFRRHDPEGLIAMGAPKDEYDPEVSAVLPLLKPTQSVDDVRRVIHGAFDRAFTGVPHEKRMYAAMAADIWQEWRDSEIRRASGVVGSADR